MSVSRTPGGSPAPKPTGSEILRMGVWNYLTIRFAPKTQPGRIIFEIGVLAVPLLILAILLKLAQG